MTRGDETVALPPAVKRAGRSVLIAARRSFRARMLPGFLIVGAERCGTTSMHRMLSQHTSIFDPLMHKKELHYFDKTYHRGLPWYQSHFPVSARARLAARPGGAAPLAFESTPYYMFHPLAPGRIAKDLPGVRLLILLRDPVERAYSAHAHQVGLGYETEPFERALDLEAERLEGEADRIVADPGYSSRSHQHYAYRTRGQYAEQLERLERLFSREQIYVVDSDEYFADPEPVYDGVLRFLGLPNRGYPVFDRYNARPRSPMSQAVRAALEEHYRPHDARLATWLGHEPSWRR